MLEKYFNCTLHGYTTRWDPSSEHVYQELAHSIVQLPGSKLLQVYNCMQYEGHVEQAMVQDVREELLQMRPQEVNITVYQNFTPCSYCTRAVLLPFIEDIRGKGYKLKFTIKSVELYQVVRMTCTQNGGSCMQCSLVPMPRIYDRTATQLSKACRQQLINIIPFNEDDWKELRSLVMKANNCYYDPNDYYWETIELRKRYDPDADIDFEAVREGWVIKEK